MAKSNFIVRGGADFSAINKSLMKTQQQFNAFQTGIAKSMKRVTAVLGAIAIGNIVKDSVKSAMTVEASMQQIDRIMGESSNTFKAWAKTQAAAFGMAREEAYKYGAVYGNLISGFAEDAQQTTQYTMALLKSSAVVSSATGRTMEDTMDRIRSGLLGNTEAIEDLGINVNVAMIESTDAFKKFANGKSWQQLNFQTQQQIRLFAILEQATKKYGDELALNTITQQLMLTAQLKNIQTSLGQAFLPIYQIVLPALTSLATKIAYVMDLIAQFSQVLFGVKQAQTQTKATTQQANAVDGLGDAYDKAGKKAKGALAGFDEINAVGANQEGADGVGMAALSGSDLAADQQNAGDMLGMGAGAAEVTAKVEEMANKVKSAFGSMSSFIKEHKDIIVSALAGLATAFAGFTVAAKLPLIISGFETLILKGMYLIDAIKVGLAGAFAALSAPITIAIAVIAALVAGFVYFYRTNEAFKGLVDGILNNIKQAAIFLYQNALIPLGNYLAGTLKVTWEKLSEVMILLWKNVLVPLGDLIGSVFIEILKALRDIFVELWKEIIVPLATFLWDIFKPAIQAIGEAFLFLWNTVLKPLIKYMAGEFFSRFQKCTEDIKVVIGGIKDIFIGLINFIAGVFTQDWERAWNGVRQIFKGVFDSLYTIVKTPLNLIIDAINTVIAGLNSIRISMPAMLGGGSFGINIPNIPKLAEGGITNGPMLAMVGDNPGGREVISPLSDLQDMFRASNEGVIEAILMLHDAMQNMNPSIELDGEKLSRIVRGYINAENNRVGKSMIVLGGVQV